MDQDVRLIEYDGHVFEIVDEMRAQIPLVELHSFEQLDRGFEGLAFLDRDHAVLAHLIHRLGQLLADLDFLVGRAGGHLLDLLAGFDRDAHSVKLVHDGVHGHVDTFLDLHRVGAGRDVLETLLENALSQNGRRRGPVAGDARSLRGHLFDHLRAHVLISVFQLDFLRDGHAVFRDGRGAERFLQNDDAAGGPERDLDGVRQLLHTIPNGPACIGSKRYLFSCHVFLTPSQLWIDSHYPSRWIPPDYFSMTAMMSASSMIRYSLPSILISVPA